MPRNPNSKRNQMRSRIAHLAARLMAEDGIQDFAVAKRKAAQQLGAPDTRHLPDNGEIEQALRVFRSLYQKEEHARILRSLREQALSAMRLLARFSPFLTGSVLSGTAGRYSDINLQLYTDDLKGLEYFLIERQIPYRAGEKRVASGDGWRVVPTYTIPADSALINIAVYSANDLRVAARSHSDGAAPVRAKAGYVEALLKAEGPGDGETEAP